MEVDGPQLDPRPLLGWNGDTHRWVRHPPDPPPMPPEVKANLRKRVRLASRLPIVLSQPPASLLNDLVSPPSTPHLGLRQTRSQPSCTRTRASVRCKTWW